MQKRKKRNHLKLLNPKNLEKEVNVYGYHFSWKTHLLFVFVSLSGIGAIGVLFQLKPVLFTIVLLVTFCLIPVLILDMYKKMYEQKRFADATTYMEQMLYSFQKSGKVLNALTETREVFESGQMRDKIMEAEDYLAAGCAQTEKGLLAEALDIIEKAYGCRKIHMIHRLLVNSEAYGGDMSDSILLVLDDLEVWKRQGYKLQQEKKTSHTDNIISICVATILCAVALYVLDGMKTMMAASASTPFNIFEVGIIQATSLFFILFSLFVYAKSTRSLTRDWLKEETMRDADYVRNSYKAIERYKDEKEQKRSLILAFPFLILAIVLFIFWGIWPAAACLALAGIMFLQHRIGATLAKKDITEELYVALPEWLMELVLLLQHNNVQVSIAKSVDGAPEVLRPELLKLQECLAAEPGKLTSYTSFCRDFDVPEISSCMKMLHAISESGTGNAAVQLNNLMQRVAEMRSQAEEIRNRSIAFRMKMLFSYPVMGATVKLLIDFAVGMVYMMQMLGSVGGGL